MEFLRQWPQGFGQQAQSLYLDREFAGLGPEQRSLGAQDIAHIPGLKLFVQAVRQRVLLDEQLNVAGQVAQPREAGLAHDPLGQHPPGDVDPQGFGVHFDIILIVISGVQFRRQRIAAKIGGISVAKLA